MATISKQNAVAKIQDSLKTQDSGKRRSTFVTVKYIKKNGDERTLQYNPAAIGGVKGTDKRPQLSFNERVGKHGQIVITELVKGKKQWRTINADTIFELSLDGETFQVT